MIRIYGHTVSIIVCYAIALHLIWAFLVLVDPSAMDATALDAISRFIPRPGTLSALLATCALLAGVGLMTRPWALWLLMPQQALLLASAAGAVQAIALGSYADGVVRPAAFIAADQVHTVLAAIGHTIAIIAHARSQA